MSAAEFIFFYFDVYSHCFMCMHTGLCVYTLFYVYSHCFMWSNFLGKVRGQNASLPAWADHDREITVLHRGTRRSSEDTCYEQLCKGGGVG